MPFIGDPRTEFSVTTPYVAGVHVVAARGEVTLATVAELQVAFEAAVGAREPVVVDLLEVSFLDSQGLYALLVLRRRLDEQDRPLAIARDPDGTLAMVFRVSGTHDFFALHDSRSSAVAAARSRSIAGRTA